MWTDIDIYTCTFIEKREGNVNITWLSIPAKLIMLKNIFWGIQKYTYCKNDFRAYQ